MKFRNFIKILLYLAIVITIPTAIATTLQELIASYNFGYTDGTLSVNLFNDYMIDTNSNGQNDTLVINLTVNSTQADYFTFFVDLNDGSGTLSNKLNQSLPSGVSYVNLSFDTRILNKNFYNYSLRIYNTTNSLIFSKYGMQTNTYQGFENGTNVNRITDESLNNNYLRINLTLNSTQIQDANLTVYLSFNQTVISATKSATLTSGIQTILVDFDNETIKSTHFVGNFTLDSILIGRKLLKPAYTTYIYNYEDFAKTSYLRNYSSSGIDTNGNNLSEFLDINFTIGVKTQDSYEIQAEIYDQFNNFVKNLSSVQTLAVGNQTVNVRLNGSDIYASKVSGPYILTSVRLFEAGNLIDKQFNAFTISNLTYTDFERPPLPDLNVSIKVNFTQFSNISNITVQVINIGQAPAFNVFLDAFNNETFSVTNNTVMLDVNQSQNYTFIVGNTSNFTLFTAIADFNNLVDESNESNNIAQNSNTIVSLKIESINVSYNNGTLNIFKFVILNDGDATVTNIQWQFDTKDNYIVNSTSNISSLAAGERAFVYVQYNFSSFGSYNVTANATGISSSTPIASSLSFAISVGDLAIISFDDIDVQGTKAIFEIQAKNNLAGNLTNLNWSLTTNTGGSTIKSASQFSTLQSNEVVFIFVQHDYGAVGTFDPTATVTNGTYTDTKSASVQINATSGNVSIKQATEFNGTFVIQNSTKTFYQNWSSNGMSGVTKLLGVNLTREGQSNRQFYGDSSQVSDVGIICHHAGVEKNVVINTTNASILSNMTATSTINTGGPRCRVMFYKNSTKAIYVYEKGFNGGFGFRLFNDSKNFSTETEIKYPYGASIGQKFISKQRPNGNETAIIFDDDGNPLKVGVVMVNFTNFSIGGLKQFYNMSFVPPHSNLTGLQNERSRRTAFAWTADGKGAVLTISNSTMSSGANDRNATILMYYYNFSLNSFNYTNGKLASSIILENTSAAVDGELCTMYGRNNNIFGVWEMKNGSVFKIMAAVLNINGTAESGYPLPDTTAETGSSSSIEYVGCYDNNIQDTVVFWWLRSSQTRLYYGLYNKTSQVWSTNNLKTTTFSTPSFAANNLKQIKKTECPETDCFGLVFSDYNGKVYGLANWNGTNISTTKLTAVAEAGTNSMQFLFAPSR